MGEQGMGERGRLSLKWVTGMGECGNGEMRERGNAGM
jgi:hypothetical protein